ncbi:MAG: hypothetical protein J3Q66DRAFT_129645 [Benniella sp.]|nr:MAG: hypothetical protein J3Q66DRAFT_129645 [Benniella sp.]
MEIIASHHPRPERTQRSFHQYGGLPQSSTQSEEAARNAPHTHVHEHWKPDLYTLDTCRRCEQAPEDTAHLWSCPATLDDQKRKWQEALESMNDIGHRAWTHARKAWERDRKHWEDSQSKQPLRSRKPFKRVEPSFKRASVDRMWKSWKPPLAGLSQR